MADNYPDKGELVLAKVERVMGYGAFVRLEEYDNKQGMVSIKEFSRKWVKNPRDYLKEGQKAVLKVLGANSERGHIDLSLKAVNDNERRNKLKEFKLEIRIEKLMERLAERMKTSKEELYKLFGDKLVDDYGSLYAAFADVANGNEDLKEYITDSALRSEVVKAVDESIKPPLVSIKGFVELSSDSSDGIEIIRESLLAGEKTFEGIDGSIGYVAPPNYRIDITTEDYKSAEKAMKDCYDAIEKHAASKGAEVHFSKTFKKAS
jgi:translation initiation factor 2 subunit 1